jgi:hypothetical protein
MYTGGADSVAPEAWQQWCSDIEALDYKGSKFGHLPVAKLVSESPLRFSVCVCVCVCVCDRRDREDAGC